MVFFFLVENRLGEVGDLMHHNMDELLNWDHREDCWCFQAFRKALSVLTQAQHKPHASLHRPIQTDKRKHHSSPWHWWGGTLILHTPCFRPQHVTPQRFWGGILARWKILWQLPACCLKSSHWVEVLASSPTCCLYSSWAKCLLLFSRGLSPSLHHSTENLLFTVALHHCLFDQCR